MTRLTLPTASEGTQLPRLDLEMAAYQDRADWPTERLKRVTSIDSLFTIAAAAMGLTVAAMQLAGRGDKLDTTAEKLAVATTILCAGITVGTLQHWSTVKHNPLLIGCSEETGYEVAKQAAMSLGAASSSLVLANPELNSLGPSHEAVAKATLALVGTSVAASLLRFSAWLGFIQGR